MRLADARALLATGANDAGAYYLAGYAVECALKASIAKAWNARLRTIGEFPYPDFGDTSFTKQNYYSHRIRELVKLAGLEALLVQDRRARRLLNTNWGIAEDWNEESRYVVFRNRQDAENIVNAVENSEEGVIAWLTNYW